MKQISGLTFAEIKFKARGYIQPHNVTLYLEQRPRAGICVTNHVQCSLRVRLRGTVIASVTNVDGPLAHENNPLCTEGTQHDDRAIPYGIFH